MLRPVPNLPEASDPRDLQEGSVEAMKGHDGIDVCERVVDYVGAYQRVRTVPVSCLKPATWEVTVTCRGFPKGLKLTFCDKCLEVYKKNNPGDIYTVEAL